MSKLGEPLRKLKKLSRLLPEGRYRRALRYGVAAAVEHASLLRTLDCTTVLDVGANVGQFALAARVCLPNATIHSFEPLVRPAAVFRRVFEGDAQVQLHQVAIGQATATVAMHVSEKDDSSSLLPITNLQNRLFPGTAERGLERVRVEPLTAMLSPEALHSPVLLKLDVQGFELPVLEGCGRMLERVDLVYVECSFVELYEKQALAEEIVLFLRERGYSLRGVHNVTYDPAGRAVQGDFFFARARTLPCAF